EALGLDPARVFKTLMATVDGRLAVAVVPVSGQLDLKALARALGAGRAAMAEVAAAERATGYVAGGISPVGQRRPHPTPLDSTPLAPAPGLLWAGGRRGGVGGGGRRGGAGRSARPAVAGSPGASGEGGGRS